jgi:hypothetical protein
MHCNIVPKLHLLDILYKKMVQWKFRAYNYNKHCQIFITILKQKMYGSIGLANKQFQTLFIDHKEVVWLKVSMIY